MKPLGYHPHIKMLINLKIFLFKIILAIYILHYQLLECIPSHCTALIPSLRCLAPIKSFVLITLNAIHNLHHKTLKYALHLWRTIALQVCKVFCVAAARIIGFTMALRFLLCVDVLPPLQQHA